MWNRMKNEFLPWNGVVLELMLLIYCSDMVRAFWEDILHVVFDSASFTDSGSKKNP